MKVWKSSTSTAVHSGQDVTVAVWLLLWIICHLKLWKLTLKSVRVVAWDQLFEANRALPFDELAEETVFQYYKLCMQLAPNSS